MAAEGVAAGGVGGDWRQHPAEVWLAAGSKVQRCGWALQNAVRHCRPDTTALKARTGAILGVQGY